MHCRAATAAGRVRADHLAVVVHADRRRGRRAGHGQVDERAAALEEAVGVPVGRVGVEARDAAARVDRGGGQAGARRVRVGHRAERAGVDIHRVAVVVAVGVGPEADRDAAVVDAEQLVHRRAGRRPGREVRVVELAAKRPEDGVVVDHAGVVHGRQESERH